MKENEVLQQCAIPAVVRDALKQHAKDNGMKVKELQADALRFLLSHREKTLRSGSMMTYSLPPRPSVTLNVVLPEGLSRIVTTAAKTDGVSVRHFIHTALMRYYTENVEN